MCQSPWNYGALTFTHIVLHHPLNRGQEGMSRLFTRLTYSSCAQGRDLSGDDEKGHQSETVFIWVCLRAWQWPRVVHQYQEAEPPALFSAQIHHSTTIDPSLQLTARFVPNQFLSPSSAPHLYSPFFIFHITPMCPPLTPLPPCHARTSHPKVSGVTPSKVIRKQQLVEKSILYQQATTGFCTYPI